MIIGLFKRSRYMNAKRELLRLFAITKSPIVGLGTSCAFGAPIIRSLGNQEYFLNKLEHKIEENSKNGIMNAAIDSWFTTTMRLLSMIIVLIPSYSIMLWSLNKNYDPTKAKEDNTKIAFFLLIAVSFAGDYSSFLTQFCFVESSLISIERCKLFEEIEPEDTYHSITQDIKNF